MFDKIKDVLGGGSKDLGDLPLGGIEKYLDNVTYPIGLDDLVVVLRENGAPQQVLGLVQGLAGKGKSSFNSKDELVETLKNKASGVI